MIENNDWRLMNQQEYLSEKTLIHCEYKPDSTQWDHDHCAFCDTIIGADNSSAYCTTDKYHWICETCFNDFSEMFHWKVIVADEKK